MLLTGQCWGLQVGMEYDYSYYGEVWAGIPEIRKQVAGVAIRADVSFQVVDVDHVLAKFVNFEVGEMNGDLPCDRDARLPVESWGPLPNPRDAKMIEDPFRFNMINVPRGEYVMEVSPDEPHWLTDIRKSVAQIFRIYPLAKNIHHKKSGLQTGDFSLKEETLFGKCTTWYQVTTVMDDLKLQDDIRLLSDMEEDSQLGRGGFTDKIWRISRKIDFAECEEFVKTRDLSMQNECGERPYQCNRGDLGRSNNGMYSLRGDENDLRLELAEIEDWAIMEPYAVGEKGYQNEQIRVMTKQNLKLWAARPIRVLMVHQTGANITTWRYDLQPPPHHAGRQPSFDEMMVGIDIDPSLVLGMMEDMMRSICEISKKLNGVSADDFVNDFDVIVFNMNYLELGQIQEINDKLEANDGTWEGLQCWKTWIKFLTNCGSKPSQEFLIKLMKTDRLPRDLQVNFFANMASNAQSTYIFKDMIDYVILREGDGDDDMNLLLIYQLTYFSNWCVQPVNKAGLTDPTCGHQHCDPDLVNNLFFPFLDKGCRNQTLPHWIRVIYMVMLCGIRSTFKNDILRPFLTGETPSSNGVRLNAVASVSLYKMPPETREECMDMLSAILEDWSESSTIRICTYAIYLTWRPTPAWWHMKALDTWKEPNRQIASLSYMLTITKYTTDRRFKWLDLIYAVMKPAPFPGLSNAKLAYYYNKILTTGWESTWMNIFLVARNDEVFPERYVSWFQPMRVGTWFPQTQVMRLLTMDMHKAQDVWEGISKYLWGTYPTKKIQEDPAVEVVRSLYNQHKDYIGAKAEEDWDYGTWYIYTKWQRSFEVSLPIVLRSEDVFNINYLIKSLPANYDFQDGLFFNYGKINIGFPSSIGLPIVFRSSSPNYQLVSGNWKLYSAQNFPTGVKVRADFDATVRSMHQVHITARILVPWNNKAVMAGFEQTFSMVYPFKYELEADTTISNDLTIKMSPRPGGENQKVGIIAAFNIPFTVRVPLYPYTNVMQANDWKIVQLPRTEQRIELLEMPKSVGIALSSLSVDYVGPYYNLFPYPHSSRTLQFWSWQVWYDPARSETKSVTISLSYERPNESMESKAWGQPINPVTRLVDFARHRLFFKKFDLFTRDPNKQRHKGKFSFEGTTEDMIRPTRSDLWKPASSMREPLRKLASSSTGSSGVASGKLTANRPTPQKLLMAYSRMPISNVTSFQDENNRFGRGWAGGYVQSSYEKYRPIESLDDVEEFDMFGSHMEHHAYGGYHDQHQMIWSENPSTYLDDVEIIEFPPRTRAPDSSQTFTVTHGRNQTRYIPEEYAHLFQEMDNGNFDYLDSMETPKHSRKKRASNIPFHTFPFTDTSDIITITMDIDLEGNNNKRVEIDFYWAQGGAEGRFGSHIQAEVKLIVGSSTPYMMCLNSEATWPYMFPIHLISDFIAHSKAGSHHQFLVNFWSGEKCIADQPSLELTGQFSLSQAGIDYINKCVVKYVGQRNCPYRLDYPAYYLLHRFYDDAQITATWFERTPTALVNSTNFLADFLTGLCGPLIWHNHLVRNEPNKAILKARRRVMVENLEWFYHYDRNAWNVDVTLPNSVSFLQDLRMFKWMEDAIMPYPFLDYNSAELIRGADAAICRIEHNLISTADHTVVWAGPTECWAVASKDCISTEEWMVLVRNDGGRLVARVLWPDYAVMFDISRDEVWINGRPVEVRDQIIGHGWKVIRQNGDMYVFFKDGQHIVRVGEFVYFMPGYLNTQRICGLCGNMNDLYYDDTMGPKGCAYGDHDLLVLAWSLASCDVCNTWELMQAKAPVYTYQQNKCQEFPQRYLAERYGKNSKAISSCTIWFYEKRKLGEYNCIAEKPSPSCKPGCVSPSKRPENSTLCASGDIPLDELTAGPLVGPWQFKTMGMRSANPACSEVPLEYKCIRETDMDPDEEHFGECKTSMYYTIIPTYVPAMCFPEFTPVFPYPGM